MFGMNSVVGKRFFKDIAYDGQPRLLVTSIFYTFQGEGPYRGKPAVFVRLAKCNLACTFCFVAGTMITMGDGSCKPIEEIVGGDSVLSWDGETFVPGSVVKTMTSETNELVSIRANGQLTTCTPEHPIRIKDRGWVEAKDVAVGDISNGLLITAVDRFTNPGNGTGQPGENWIRYSGKEGAAVKTYNFEVEDTHTYVANGLVVHNCDTYFDDGEYMAFDQIMATATADIVAKLDSGLKATNEDFRAFVRQKVGLVVTGGEPLLQDDLGQFLAATRHKFAWQQIETNGTQPAINIPKNVTVVVSPKCAEKDGVPTKYLGLHPSLRDRVSCLKFVVDHNDESPYRDIPDWAKTMAGNVDIYCSPMNIYAAKPMQAKTLKFEGKTTVTERSRVDEVISFWEPGLLDMAANRKNHEYTAALCVKRGYIFNVQQHLLGGVA